MGSVLDVHCTGASVRFLNVRTRVPLKFGSETLTQVTCARVNLAVENRDGRRASGWGETPLSVQWVWPGPLSYEERHAALSEFCIRLTGAWASFPAAGHPMEIGHAFLEACLPALLREFNLDRSGKEMPWLAALACCSAFDIALHDAYGVLHGVPVYTTYKRPWMNADLSAFLIPEAGTSVSFHDKYPADYLAKVAPARLPAWHLVGGLDPIHPHEIDGSGPDDGHPVLLRDWIRQDGLTCLKVKLRGNDSSWDYRRLSDVGLIAIDEGCLWLSADFNCTVTDPAYVNEILDRLMAEHPRVYGMVLYVEQPFPYELEQHAIDVHSVSARKPLFMDESAHDWRLVRRGRQLGWTGVALKTCKTQTGALLSLCWARAHGMTLMVQDLTNPMLAQIPHVMLAAHAGTIMGVETNGMQFYPDASNPEAVVHPGLYRRRGGCVDTSTISGAGFGYQLDRIGRVLPEAAVRAGQIDAADTG